MLIYNNNTETNFFVNLNYNNSIFDYYNRYVAVLLLKQAPNVCVLCKVGNTTAVFDTHARLTDWIMGSFVWMNVYSMNAY